MPNTAIPSPFAGSDDKEQVLNIGKHPSLVRVNEFFKEFCLKLSICLIRNFQIKYYFIQGSLKKMQAAVKRKQQEQGEMYCLLI